MTCDINWLYKRTDMATLIIDGYNAIRRIERFLAAEKGGLEAGRDALLMALEAYGAATGMEIIVVFDGGGRPAGDEALGRATSFAGVDVIYSGRGQSADFEIDRILKTYAKERKQNPYDLILVTDDFGIRDDAMGCGAFVASPDDLDRAMMEGRALPY